MHQGDWSPSYPSFPALCRLEIEREAQVNGGQKRKHEGGITGAIEVHFTVLSFINTRFILWLCPR